MFRIPMALLALALALPSAAPISAASDADRAPAVKSLYVGHNTRPIKSLTQNEIDDLLAGNGAGLALAAELNGYPGPRHVLELADALALDATQLRATRRLRDDMQARASALGREIVEVETALDRAFALQTIDRADLQRRTAKIAALAGQLRAVHLEAHLAQRALLSESQNARYAERRGYGAGGGHGHR